MSFSISFAAASIVALASVMAQVRIRGIRRRRLAALELRPNCLLTRHPILFVNGRRSLFRLFEPWNDVPAYLREHGYDVLVIDPPSRTSCSSAVLNTLEDLQGKYHLIGDSSLESDFIELALSRHPRIATLTLSKSRPEHSSVSGTSSPPVSALKPLPANLGTLDLSDLATSSLPISGVNRVGQALLWLHNALGFGRRPKVDAIETGHLIFGGWAVEGRFLDLAISLAERDAQWSD